MSNSAKVGVFVKFVKGQKVISFDQSNWQHVIKKPVELWQFLAVAGSCELVLKPHTCMHLGPIFTSRTLKRAGVQSIQLGPESKSFLFDQQQSLVQLHQHEGCMMHQVSTALLSKLSFHPSEGETPVEDEKNRLYAIN